MSVSQRVIPPSGFIPKHEGWLWSVWRARNRRGFRRTLRIFAFVVVGLELGYLLGANLVLKTGLIERFINDEEIADLIPIRTGTAAVLIAADDCLGGC